jgi:hypothetical protein
MLVYCNSLATVLTIQVFNSLSGFENVVPIWIESL